LHPLRLQGYTVVVLVI